MPEKGEAGEPLNPPKRPKPQEVSLGTPGRLIVDHNFCTTDPGIFGVGTGEFSQVTR